VLSHKGRAGDSLHGRDQTCGFLAAARLSVRSLWCPPILRDGLSALLRMRGMARRKAQTYGSGPLPDTAGASRRANRGVFTAAGPAFRLGCLRLSQSLERHSRSSSPKAGSANIQVVSQLLAGTPGGPGGSSDAARVPDLRRQARGRRTSSRCRNASRSALQVDEVMRSVREVLRAGDKV